MSGHRPGCRCVGCSPATRARGMRALRAAPRRRQNPMVLALYARTMQDAADAARAFHAEGVQDARARHAAEGWVVEVPDSQAGIADSVRARVLARVPGLRSENPATPAARKYVSRQISLLERGREYSHPAAVAIALKRAREAGYRSVPLPAERNPRSAATEELLNSLAAISENTEETVNEIQNLTAVLSGENPRRRPDPAKGSYAYRAGYSGLMAEADRRGSPNLIPSIAEREAWGSEWRDFMRGWTAAKKAWRPNPRRNPWQMSAGGTGAAEGKHGYSIRTGVGEYHIFPFTTRTGRHAGYMLKYADTSGRLGRGLWHDLGVYRSPNAAKRAAREHATAQGLPALNPLTRRETGKVLRRVRTYHDVSQHHLAVSKRVQTPTAKAHHEREAAEWGGRAWEAADLAGVFGKSHKGTQYLMRRRLAVKNPRRAPRNETPEQRGLRLGLSLRSKGQLRLTEALLKQATAWFIQSRSGPVLPEDVRGFREGLAQAWQLRNPLTRVETAQVIRHAQRIRKAARTVRRGASRYLGPARASEISLADRYQARASEAAYIAHVWGKAKRAYMPNPPRVVGTIPGGMTKIYYNRVGKYRGPYVHKFSRGVRAFRMSDGSILLRGAKPLWVRQD